MTIAVNRTVEGSQAARRAMIDSQLRTSGVNEPFVLAAMMRVAREDFVPAAMKSSAYIDRAIALDNGRALAAPLFHGKMLAEAAPQSSDSVLLIGDGNGYLAALLRPIVGSLTAVAPGEKVEAPQDGYSLILIDGAIEILPETVVAALREGGRIVTGLAQRSVTQIAFGRKSAGRVALLALAEIGIPVLPEFAAPKRWSF